MAIKGKGRTRGRRTVAAPPKRAIVVRKPPIWRRRWLWMTAAVLALVGILSATFVALNSRNASKRKEREVRAVTAYLNQFRSHLPTDRVAVPPDAIVIFPSVQDDIDNFKNLSAADIEKKGKALSAAAAKSASGLENVAIARLVPEEFAGDRGQVGEAQFLIAQAYHLYQPVGALFQQAGRASGATRQELLDQAQSLINRAGTMFDRGYVKLVRIATRLGIPIKTAYQPAPAVPGGNATPTPPASPSASPSA